MPDEQTQRYYRARAPEYEQIYYRDNPPRRKEIDDEAAFLRELAADRDVLDLACGTGYWTQILAKRASMVVAADLAPEMIMQARGKQYPDRRGNSGVASGEPHFVIADLERPPFAPHAFDLIVLGFWLSHQPKQTYDEFFARIGRLVKPGGLIWMIDNNPPAEGPTIQSTGIDEHGNNYKQRFLDDGERFVILKNYFGRDELAGIADRYGRLARLVYGVYYWSMLLEVNDL